MLTRLIYASEASPSLTSDQLQALLETARRHNPARGLTGLLIYNHRHFLQVLEGDRSVVSELYNRIVTDTRHSQLQIIDCQAVDRRQFDRWGMGFAAANAGHRQLYLRHGSRDELAPQQLSAPSALSLLAEFAAQVGSEQVA